jgi:hypothetical protein
MVLRNLLNRRTRTGIYGGVSMGRCRPANSNENGLEQPRMMAARLDVVEVVVTLDELRPWWCLIWNA